MAQSLALTDLVLPYVVRGFDLAAHGPFLSALRVESFESATDTAGTVIRGRATFQGHVSIDTANLGARFVNDEDDPPFDPDRRAAVFDIRETRIDFELFAPHAPSSVISSAVSSISEDDFAAAREVLDVWSNSSAQHFPGAGFTLDLILVAPTLRPPGLHPAQATPEGGLISDPTRQEVAITLPRMRFRLEHGNAANGQLRAELVSAGVGGLDDPGAIGIAELVSMDPPYAFIGGRGERSIGIGFRRAVLDLSDGHTPPDITEKFGFGDDWAGLFLPELRFYVAPDGARDLAFAVGVRDLLIGFGPHAGVSGDFEAALINQGSGTLAVSARFFDEDGHAHGIERLGSDRAEAALPQTTRMVVDVEGGRAPYSVDLRVNNGPATTGSAFDIELSGAAPVELRVAVEDSTAGTPLTATLIITARRRTAPNVLPVPRGAAAVPQPATVTPTTEASPRIVLVRQTDTEVTLTLEPRETTARWSVDGGADGSARAVFTLDVAPGAQHIVQARIPAVDVEPEMLFFYHFEEPHEDRVKTSTEEEDLAGYAAFPGNVWSTQANSRMPGDGREAGGGPPLAKHANVFALIPPGTELLIQGEASYENDAGKLRLNYLLARRRAIATRELLRSAFDDRFVLTIDPEPMVMEAYPELGAWTNRWQDHEDEGAGEDRQWWRATIILPDDLSQPERVVEAEVERPADTEAPPSDIVPRDPPPSEQPRPPDWFRSARLKVRILRNKLVALEIEGEIDVQTATEERLAASGQLDGNPPPNARSLENGTPLSPGNPADGITRLRLLMQGDDATGRISALVSIGADPADRDGLLAWGPLPGEPTDAEKDFGRTLLGSYLSFWPLLANMPAGNTGRIEDTALTGVSLAAPGIIAGLPWFRVERVILYGAEYEVRAREEQTEAFLLFDVQADWSASIPNEDNFLIRIRPERPLGIRYKAIGLRLSNREDDGSTAPQFSLRPVFDASRGFTIDLVKGGLEVAEPLGRILRVAGARLSRTNPLTMEVDLALGADLGVVAIDAASFRVFMENPPRVELTALAARVDIPGALIGKGYLQISEQEIAGQIDLTIRPIGLRVSASLGIASLERPDGSPATGIYAGLELLLPVGIPLGGSGLGIFGFRGLFGMHYERNPELGLGSAVPALEWLKASNGRPHDIVAEDGTRLWTPRFGQWAFGLGIQLGTMEGGFILNLDGTLILELPGPRLLIVMNARFLQPPPGIDSLGQSGILSVIEITPESLLIGILARYEIPLLVRIVIPVEAYFNYADNTDWHIYIGTRPDIDENGPIDVDVLGLVKGSGYLMVTGNGLPEYLTLPEINGFAIGVGAGAAFVWGNVDVGLYLRIGGRFDAVIGFEPFILGGRFEISGELRLFIISIGAHANLTIIVRETDDGVRTSISGEICGEINLFFFKIRGCVGFDLGEEAEAPPVPPLVRKLSLKARSPALAVGTAVDRPVDGSLGDAPEGDTQPDDMPVVPIDSIPVLAMVLPAASNNASFLGTDIGDAPSLSADGFAGRGAERYRYSFSAVVLQRVGEEGDAVIGTGTPATWWTQGSATGDAGAAQLALLTWEPDPATKALETNELRREQINQRWGAVCEAAAPPAPVLWTFRFERVGTSAEGWSVEGVAWPDPPATQRSEPAITRLDVVERWRSGDAQLDAARGIMAAMVPSNPVPCLAAAAPPSDLAPRLRVGGRGPVVDGETGGAAGLALAETDPILTRLIRADGKQPFRVSGRLAERAAAPPAVAPISLATLLNQLQNGLPIGYEEAQALLAGGAASQTTFPQGCRAKVLIAPRLDDGRPVVLGDLDRAEEIEAALIEAGVTHGPLDDVVVLRTGPVAQLTLLLFATRADILAGRVVARLLNATGAQVVSVVATAADIVPPRALPGRWTAPSGPWTEDIADALAFRTADPTLAASHVPVLLTLAGRESVDRVEIGLLPLSPEPPRPGQMPRPPWYLAVVESLSFAEVERHAWDTGSIDRDRQTITSYLGPDSTDNALLHPNSVYRVAVAWQGERAEKPEHEIPAVHGAGSQSFWFRTDNAAPARLDPWVLTTWPDEREAQVFGGEPLRLVFNTHDVDRLYAAYGRELRLRLQAASARVPVTPGGPDLPLPLSGEAGTLTPSRVMVMAPFEGMLVDLLQGQCIPIDEDRPRHSEVLLPVALEPYSDYILDIVSVPQGADPDEAGERVLRRQFSTGGYRSLGEFAARLAAMEVRHAAVTPGVLAAALTPFAGRQPQGGEFDAALRAIGLDALPTTSRSSMTVLWQHAGIAAPQPVAVLVDAEEPLWRSRAHPHEEPDPDGMPGTRRWRMAQVECLALEQGPDADAVLGPAGVVRAPGSQRALVVLAAAQRGRRLRLDLVRPAFPEPFLELPEERHRVFDLRLDRAPWEE